MRRTTGLLILSAVVVCTGQGQPAAADAADCALGVDGRPRVDGATAGAAFDRCPPLLPVPEDWSFNDTWVSGPIGGRDFYFAENGPYARGAGNRDKGWVKGLAVNGLTSRLITGYLPNRYLQWFAPGAFEKTDAQARKVIRDILEQRWPFYSIAYVTARGEPVPSPAAREAMGDLWLGDGAPEYLTYRLEPVMKYLHSGKYWSGSSANWTAEDSWSVYMEQKLLPSIDRALPKARDPDHVWTHHEARVLSDLFMQTYFEKIGRPVAWGAYLSPYSLASRPDNVAVAQRYSDPRYVAQRRGIERSAGGGKFSIHSHAAEHATRWHGWGDARPEIFDPRYEAHGYNLDHVRLEMWRPFLTGAHMFYTAMAPTGFVSDVEGDGHYELNALGEIAVDVLDFSEVLRDRGVPIASVGLLLDHDRELPLDDARPGSSYKGLGIPFDDADQMIAGLFRHIFPKHEDTLDYKLGNYTAPYGEIFDVLVPNIAGRAVDPAVLANYKILFDLGGLNVDAQLAEALVEYVDQGGVLVMSVSDLGEHLEPSFFGVKLGGGWARGRRVRFEPAGPRFEEQSFRYRQLRLDGAEVLYSVDGNPLVTRHRVGRGQAILLASHNLNQAKAVRRRIEPGGPGFEAKPLLGFVPDLLDRLTAGSMPVELRTAPEHRKDLTWWVHRRGDDWLVFVLGYSQQKAFERRGGHSINVIGDYEYSAIPFELVFNVPVADGVDLNGTRNVPLRPQGGGLVASGQVRYGEIRAYQFSAEPIELPPRERFVNFALGRPVEASSTLTRPGHRPRTDAPETRRFAPQKAVDGDLDNRSYWQSGRGDPGDKRAWLKHAMPAWLQIDLETTRLVDHVRVQFHHRPVRTHPDMRPRILRYTVELSENGRRWKTVVDESHNAKPLRPRVIEKWFEPMRARFARLTVSWNSDRLGAQVVEFGVYGRDKELFTPERRSPWEPSRAWLPLEIQHWPREGRVFLADLAPVRFASTGGGRRPQSSNRAAVRTYDHTYWGGHVYEEVLRVDPPHEAVYHVPPGARYFAAVAGFSGLSAEKPGAVYRIFLDGEERFDSGPYHGLDALPIVLELDGAKELKLVVENLGDGSGSPTAYLAEARFLVD